jgi:hypothetical protein
MTLAEDPIVLGVNFFGEMNSGYDRLMMNIPDVAPLGEVEWRKWLKAKYGSIEKLNEEWKQKTPLKSFEDVNIHYRERAGRPTSDWYRFISYKHEKFNTFCRGVIEKAGYKGLVWEGDGSRRMSEILPRGTTSDIVPIDIYYCHPRGSWGRVGNSVGQESAISRNGSYILTTLSTKINDRPLIVTEHNYCFWNPHVYEGGLLMPAYGAFQGFSQFLVHVNPVTKAPKSLDAFGAGEILETLQSQLDHAGAMLVGDDEEDFLFNALLEPVSQNAGIHTAGVDAGQQLLGKWGLLFLGLAVLGAILSGIIGFYMATSRLLYSMSKEKVLPAWFGKLDVRFKTPSNAILFVLVIALAAPFFGRTALGWIVDMSSIGAAIGYGYTSMAAYRFASRERNFGVMFTGIIGTIMALIFMILLLVPIPMFNCSLGRESYICLIIWIIMGVIFYIRSGK